MGGGIKERPILFSAPMIRAILAGTKTQTRRVINHIATLGRVSEFQRTDTPGYDWIARDSRMRWNELRDADLLKLCPYGIVGDRLWVRETWKLDHAASGRAFYRASWGNYENGERWRPSIHMPRWASRIALEVAAVRVERLNDISTADAYEEGAPVVSLSPQGDFRALWESINGPGSWDTNPWVWVVEFERVDLKIC